MSHDETSEFEENENAEDNLSLISNVDSGVLLNNDEEGIAPPAKKIKYSQQTRTFNISKFNTKTKPYFIGKLNIGSTNCCFENNWWKCKIEISEDVMIFGFDNYLHAVIQSSETSFITSIFASKIFDFDFISETSQCYMFLYLRKLPLKNLSKKLQNMLQQLMVKFYSINMNDVYEQKNVTEYEDLNVIYENVKKYSLSKVKTTLDKNLDVQHPSLLPKLRMYQIDAVRWMLHKEKTTTELMKMNPMFVCITLETQKEIYYNKFTGHIQEEKPFYNHNESGGILADEMGLGKTVEVLACILSNPRCIDDCTNGINKVNVESGDDIPSITTQHKMIKSKANKKHSTMNAPQNNNTKLFSMNKSPAKIAAQLWYESKLAEVQIKPKTKPAEQVDEVQCICGNFEQTCIVTCCDCKKQQHRSCMNYSGEQVSYVCPQCWLSRSPIKSKATLIVSPASISHQWSLEVLNHIRKDGLTVLVYKGIHQAGMVYPTDLAKYDLVITTYNVLQSELKFSNDQQVSISLRHAKRYNVPSTPLLSIEWWRICFDEAQLLECPTSLVSSMARQLNSVHRWAVTGTPIQKNMKDMFGLIDYLQLEPYDDISSWNNMLYFPYVNGVKEPMLDFLSDNMWRSAKTDVIDQIKIPPQTFMEHYLDFSPVEKHLYSRQYGAYSGKFLEKLSTFPDLSVTVKSLDRRALNSLLTPLSVLRKTCAHSFSMRGKFLATKRKITSMEELLEVMIEKNVRECEECLRAVIASLNGTAGVLLLKGLLVEAVEKYREVLSFMKHYDEQKTLKIDKLQRIHTLHNLNEVLHTSTCDIPTTLRDDTLKEECDTLQQKYMEKYINLTVNATADAEAATATFVNIKNQFENNVIEWCSAILNWCLVNSMENEVLLKIRSVTCGYSKLKQKITSIPTLLYILSGWSDDADKNLKIIYKEFKKIKLLLKNNNNCFPNNEVDKAMDCHLRTNRYKKPKTPCLCCMLDTKLKKYECVIFQMRSKQEKNKVSNTGTWNPCLEERLLKGKMSTEFIDMALCFNLSQISTRVIYSLLPVIFTFGKQKSIDAEVIREGEQFFALCEARRKEFKDLRRLYTFYDQQISAQDELNICKIRYRLRDSEDGKKVIQKKRSSFMNLDYETENKYEFINLLWVGELDEHMYSLERDRMTGIHKLRTLFGTLEYLDTLRRQQYAGENPDPCPICHSQLAGSWGIFYCGHCYCIACIHRLVNDTITPHYIKCCVCRKAQLVKDIAYVREREVANDEDVEVTGSFPTKVYEVVKCALQLRRADPNVKILIFSTWDDVLKLLSEAFTVNGVDHERFMSSNMHEKLQNFKDDTKNVTVLLLPIRLGAKGLNLVEATHVFLVEPLMNPAEELQAIGRVHRIGQTKPTVVHRFLIKDTIEENIHKAVSADVSQWDDRNLTLLHLKNLFSENDNLNISNVSK